MVCKNILNILGETWERALRREKRGKENEEVLCVLQAVTETHC